MCSLKRFLLPFVALLIALALGQSEMKGAFIANTPIVTPGGCFVGTGCDNRGYYTATNTAGDLSISLGVIERFVGAILPTSGNNYIVPTGTNGGGLALWNVNFSFTVPTQLLNYTFVLAFSDLNRPGTLTNPLIFSPGAFPDNEYRTAGGVETTGTYAANAATAVTMQQSTNLGFFFPGFNPNEAHTYQVFADIRNLQGQSLVSNNIVINASQDFNQTGEVPEPSTYGMMVFGLCLLIAGVRRRRRQVLS